MYIYYFCRNTQNFMSVFVHYVNNLSCYAAILPEDHLKIYSSYYIIICNWFYPLDCKNNLTYMGEYIYGRTQ